MKTSGRILPLLLLLAFFACKTSQKSAAAGKDDGVIEVVFLQMNDVYEISPLSNNAGGLARVASIRQELLKKNPNTYTVLSGDFISPSVIGTLKFEDKRIRGRQMVETLNALGLDYVVFGNHEFDYDDMADLQARLNESNFTWLSGNAQQIAGDMIRPFVQKRATGDKPCPENIVVQAKDADGTTLNIGIFGVLINSGQKPYVVYSDAFAAARKSTAELKTKSDVVVGLTHLAIEDDLKLAAQLPEVPLIMGGHDHDNMMHHVGNTTVAKADANAKTVYVHYLRYDKKTKQASVRSELRQVNGSIPDEAGTAAVVAKWEKIKQDALTAEGFDAQKKVTDLSAPLDCRETIVRHQQTQAGKYITSAMLAAGRHRPDGALLNSGSIRVDDILTGTLTELDVIRMLPFGGGMSEVQMKGSLLRRTLDAGWLNEGNGGYLQLGLLTRDEGKKAWLVNYKPLDESKNYWIILPDFLLTGRETKLEFLKTAPSADGKGTTNPDVLSLDRPKPGDKTDLRADIRQALIAYLRK